MGVRFLTREIGSLAKPPWAVKASAGRPLEDEDIEHARQWGERLTVEGHEALVETITAGQIGESELAQIAEWSALYALKLLEDAGLDVVYDGEQRRTEMYDHVITNAHGFAPRGTVRSFDNKYYAKAAVVDPPSVEAAYDLDEYRFVAAHTDRRVKAPFTGPYTIVDWSYDEFYGHRSALGATLDERTDARRRFLLDVAEHVVRPNAAAVAEAGCEWIQIDEPALTTRPDEVPLGIEAFNASVAGIDASCSLHVCFSDYRLLFPHVLELENCLELQLEFANRDAHQAGTSGAERPGYEPLFLFKEHGGPAVGLGVLDVHTDFVEPAELVRDRVLYATALLGPERIYVNPDCGLRTRSWEVAFEKLRNMVEGTRLAEAALNGA
jgi:5-methyltetrahydropteroyltriglutamate--homocysteine methyltransferase